MTQAGLWETRTKEIIVLKEINPKLNGAEIARRVGTSREWVRQVLGRVSKSLSTPRRRCPICGKRTARRDTFCKACYLEHNRVAMTCYRCGRIFSLTHGDYRARRRGSRRLYCSRACWISRKVKRSNGLWPSGAGNGKRKLSETTRRITLYPGKEDKQDAMG